MFKSLLVILSIFTTLIAVSSCRTHNFQLLVQNNTQEDSSLVTVKVNGFQVFTGHVKRAVTNYSFEESHFESYRDSLRVEAEIPEIGLKQMSVSGNADQRQVIVIIRSVVISGIPARDGQLKTIPRKKEILIGFFGKESHKYKAL